ncbi:hypothetical protein NXW75_03520 [Bacteroides xylanisolvens]|nr:hypothetical protein [Bacteroides xylanisolvens]
METKVCKECGQSLPISNFSKNKATKDGLANYCKKCDKERRRKSSGGITQQGVKATLKMSDFDDNMLFAELRRRGYTRRITLFQSSKYIGMYTSYGWELTNLLQGQDEEYLLEVLTENYRRLRDVPDHLIVTLLEYRGYTWEIDKK